MTICIVSCRLLHTTLFPFPLPTPKTQIKKEMKKKKEEEKVPVPIRYTNLLFLASILFLLRRWREKIRLSIPLHVLDLAELIAIVSLVGSLIYLPSFFGIALVQTIVDDEDTTTNNVAKEEEKKVDDDDKDIIASVVAGSVPSYSLESRLGDYRRTAGVRHEALKRITVRKIRGLPLDGFDYDSILLLTGMKILSSRRGQREG